MSSTFVPDLFFLMTEAGYGVLGTTLFRGAKAVLPDVIPVGFRALISINRTGGSGEVGTHNLSRFTVAYETPAAQIVCRAYNPQDAEDVAEELYALLNFYDTLINGTWWRVCGPKQEVFELPVDTKGRSRFVFNIESEKRVSPATS